MSPEKLKILLTTWYVQHVLTDRNVDSGLYSWNHADLELNTTNRTSDGVKPMAAEERPGQSDHSVPNSWDNTGVIQIQSSE